MSHTPRTDLTTCRAELATLRAALQTQAEEAAKHNAWMSQVHGLCFDLGIAPGHIEDRLFEAIGRVNMLIEQRDELVGALQSAINQVEYLHRKFQETGSGNGFIAQCQQLLSKAT